MTATQATTYAINQAFTYDANNNLTFWDDKINNAYDLQATYDGLDRLNLITDSYSGTGDVNYDSMGNITYYKIGNQTLNYVYNSSKQLSSVSGYQSKTFSYDDKGNITGNGVHTFNYNTAGQMSSSDVGNYVYDGHNKRVKKDDGESLSYSMYSQAGKLVYRNVDGVNTDYYLGNKLVAKRKGSQVTYIHTDFLGSPAAESNTAGVVTSKMHYQPFGASIETPKDDVGYTGHKFDKALDLSYMQARYYDPAIGRFYSSDPVGYTAKNPIMSFNRYLYANNNPFKYTDPDGRFSLEFLKTMFDFGNNNETHRGEKATAVIKETGRFYGQIGKDIGNSVQETAGPIASEIADRTSVSARASTGMGLGVTAAATVDKTTMEGGGVKLDGAITAAAFGTSVSATANFQVISPNPDAKGPATKTKIMAGAGGLGGGVTVQWTPSIAVTLHAGSVSGTSVNTTVGGVSTRIFEKDKDKD